MARIRSVKPELCLSSTMAECSAEEERTFVRLWTHLDDSGLAVDNPRLIVAALFPMHDDVTHETIDRHLDALAAVGLIVRYVVDGKRYLACPSWSEHQKPQKVRESKLPGPDEADSGTTTVHVRDVSRSSTVGVWPCSCSCSCSGSCSCSKTLDQRTADAAEDRPSETGPAPEASPVPTASAPGASLELSPAPVVKARDEGYPDDFSEWWALYPRKVGKGKAAKAYRKAVEAPSVSPNDLLESLGAAVPVWESEGLEGQQFIPHPATWLNEKRYDDPPPVARARERGPADSTRANIAAYAKRKGLTE